MFATSTTPSQTPSLHAFAKWTLASIHYSQNTQSYFIWVKIPKTQKGVGKWDVHQQTQCFRCSRVDVNELEALNDMEIPLETLFLSCIFSLWLVHPSRC